MIDSAPQVKKKKTEANGRGESRRRESCHVYDARINTFETSHQLSIRPPLPQHIFSDIGWSSLTTNRSVFSISFF
jgi:hypothetical protein